MSPGCTHFHSTMALLMLAGTRDDVSDDSSGRAWPCDQSSAAARRPRNTHTRVPLGRCQRVSW